MQGCKASALSLPVSWAFHMQRARALAWRWHGARVLCLGSEHSLPAPRPRQNPPDSTHCDTGQPLRWLALTAPFAHSTPSAVRCPGAKCRGSSHKPSWRKVSENLVLASRFQHLLVLQMPFRGRAEKPGGSMQEYVLGGTHWERARSTQSLDGSLRRKLRSVSLRTHLAGHCLPSGCLAIKLYFGTIKIHVFLGPTQVFR